MTRNVLVVLVLAALCSLSALSQPGGRTYEVTVTNLTSGQIFSPPLVVIHSPQIALFTAGQPASAGLAALAEDGSPATLLGEIDGSELVYGTAVAPGPVPPGQSTTFEVEAAGPGGVISFAGMLVITNDTFFAATMTEPRRHVVRGLPARRQAQSTNAVAYDAGSEANTESCEHIPGPPCTGAGVRVTEGAEGFVHVADGVHGIASLEPEVHDWRNPVARISVTRID